MPSRGLPDTGTGCVPRAARSMLPWPTNRERLDAAARTAWVKATSTGHKRRHGRTARVSEDPEGLSGGSKSRPR
jgi:hypothetical protein